MNLRRLGRVAAAAILVASTIAVGFIAQPAGAVNSNVTADCSVTPSPVTINNSDTVTFTLGSGCGAVILFAGSGTTGSAQVTSPFPANLQLGSPMGGLSGGTVVFTAPASGSGSTLVGFMATAQSQPAITYTISYPVPTPRNDTIVDNGNGSVTWTFAPLSGQNSTWFSLYPAGTTCPPTSSLAGRVAVVPAAGSNAPANAVSSPATIWAGTPAFLGATLPPSSGPIPAGTFQACSYYSSGGSTQLVASSSVTLAPEGATPAEDPVTPSYTG